MFAQIRKLFQSAHNDRGQVAVLAAFLIVALGGAAAISVDVGNYMSHRRSMQNAVDAITLAASLELPDENAATAVAEDWAEQNGIDPDTMTIIFTQQSLPDHPNPSIRVELDVPHDFTFARLLGIAAGEVEVNAAGIRTSPGGSNGLMPWSVLEAVKSTALPGQSLVLKYDSNNVTTGNFGALRLDGNGSSVYRNTIKFGSENTYCAVSAPDCDDPSVVSTETGNMTGPTQVGTDYRIDNTSAGCDTWEEVVTALPDGTHGLKPACNPFVPGGDQNSLRVIVIPVINNLCNGSCDVTILEFALFFLEGYGDGGCTGNDCEIEGRFIYSNTNYGAVVGTFDADTTVHFVRLIN